MALECFIFAGVKWFEKNTVVVGACSSGLPLSQNHLQVDHFALDMWMRVELSCFTLWRVVQILSFAIPFSWSLYAMKFLISALRDFFVTATHKQKNATCMKTFSTNSLRNEFLRVCARVQPSQVTDADLSLKYTFSQRLTCDAGSSGFHVTFEGRPEGSFYFWNVVVFGICW